MIFILYFFGGVGGVWGEAPDPEPQSPFLSETIKGDFVCAGL